MGRLHKKNKSSYLKVIDKFGDFVKNATKIRNITTFEDNDEEVLVEVEIEGYEKVQCPSNNVVVASYVTSYARDEIESAFDLFKTLDPQCQLIYTDTDCIGKKIK